MTNSVSISIMTNTINIIHINQSFVESPLSFFFLINFYWTVVALQCREQIYGCQGRMGAAGGMNWETGTDVYALLILCIK